MSYPYVQPKNLMNRPQIEVVCLLLDATATISTNLILPRIYVHFLNVFSLMNRVCSTPLSLSRLSIDSHAVEYFCCVRPAWQNLIVSAFLAKLRFWQNRIADILACIVSENR